MTFISSLLGFLFFIFIYICQPSLQIDFPTGSTPLNKKEVVLRLPTGSPSPQQPPGSPLHPLDPPGSLQPHAQPNRPDQNKESTFLENTSKDTATQKAGLTEEELVIIFKI